VRQGEHGQGQGTRSEGGEGKGEGGGRQGGGKGSGEGEGGSGQGERGAGVDTLPRWPRAFLGVEAEAIGQEVPGVIGAVVREWGPVVVLAMWKMADHVLSIAGHGASRDTQKKREKNAERERKRYALRASCRQTKGPTTRGSRAFEQGFRGAYDPVSISMTCAPEAPDVGLAP